MSQHVVYSNSAPRGSHMPYETANFRLVPVDAHGPVRGQYGPEPGPRGAPRSYEVHDRRMVASRVDHGRPEFFNTDSSLGQGRGLFDSQRVDQARQVRPAPIDSNSRYYENPEFESVGQTSGGSWGQLPFDPQLATELDAILDSQHCAVGPDSTPAPSSSSSGPQSGSSGPVSGPVSGPPRSPKSSVGRGARSSTRASETSNNSDDNLSTATTAVDSASDSDISQTLSRFASILVKIQEDQTTIMQMIEKMAEANQQMAIANKDMATATTTRLNDFRDHVDKKFERSELRADGAIDELYERVEQGIHVSKRIREAMSGNDPRRTPPNDDINHLFEPSKRRRFD
ncbi:hypothetical protein DL95DRAFT_399598, partial [Leptodontidium sp. 2 PMI_412]